MVQYVRDSLPQCCTSIEWVPQFRNRQLSEDQNTALFFNQRLRFYTNVNRWNLFTPAQIEMYGRMRVDNRGRYANAFSRSQFGTDLCNRFVGQ
jgi:hypothetical protein